MNKIDHVEVQSAVTLASEKWKAGFNSANPNICAAAYHEDAVMEVGGMGSFIGKAAIFKFWQDFILSGAKDVEYFDTKMDVIDTNTVLLTSNWKMNVGQGRITKEKWCRQHDNQWLLTEDAFEMTEKFI
ncbi:nuclear transport factor 2 family protein [Kiloniella laminariae]|uniref:Nuclear transport factor 2 family protein n=1 Tax=Kiloniella laminariae TaxID=454162 RepID=A0ABT4LLZ7_9PROT|nr:nuclear transport factor 2 family protein [Kiloniella laminariae]MCZ4282129.1 nuclear transport factor 2 family protein [Kiloniella laminariae]